MICRRGGIDKSDIGAIRIMDTTTEFEISARAAESFAVKIRRPDKEDNIRIEAIAGCAAPTRRRFARRNGRRSRTAKTQRPLTSRRLTRRRITIPKGGIGASRRTRESRGMKMQRCKARVRKEEKEEVSRLTGGISIPVRAADLTEARHGCQLQAKHGFRRRRCDRPPFCSRADRRGADAVHGARRPISVPADQDHRAVRTGRVGRHHRAPDRQADRGENQAGGRHRQPPRRQRHHRHHGGEDRRARRLYGAADHHQHPCRQCQPRAQSVLRSGEGFHRRRRVSFQRQLSDGAAAGAVARSCRLHRRRQGRARQADLRLFQCLLAHAAGISRQARRASSCRACPIARSQMRWRI